MHYSIVILFCPLIQFYSVSGSKVDKRGVFCHNAITCGECIQAPGCAWCMDPNLWKQARCFDLNLGDINCSDEFIYYPDNTQLTLMNERFPNYDFSITSESFNHRSQSKGANGPQNRLSIAPQKIKLTLRPKFILDHPHGILLSYKETEDVRYDLYFLVDLSKSMEDDYQKIKKFQRLLSVAIRNFTSNYRLGLGSYIEPTTECDDCDSGYLFRNHLSLTTDTRKFKMQNITMSKLLDVPEGGVDALMQSMVCKSQIGWRQKSRKVLIIATDAWLRFGINQTNNEENKQCHLDGSRKYVKLDKSEGPTVRDLVRISRENDINVIFAVTESLYTSFVWLSQQMRGSSVVALSENITTTVMTNLLETLKFSDTKVEMIHNAPSNVNITYYTNCSLYDDTIKTNKCDNIQIGAVVHFTLNIELKSCPKDSKDWNKKLKVYNKGSNDYLEIDLEIVCACPCELPEHPMYIVNSTHCKYNGILKCGKCECSDQYYGDTCECYSRYSFEESSDCRPNNATFEVCAGRGQCRCGKCICRLLNDPEMLIYGKYCECDNFSCPKHDEKICGGPSRGSCSCGKCMCKDHWYGPSCGVNENQSCYRSGVDHQFCSGRGECKYGTCLCKSGFSGKYCQEVLRPIEVFQELRRPAAILDNRCVPDASKTQECSNRGICVDGKCFCFQRSLQKDKIYGQFCECDNFSCPKYDRMVCGGTERGFCECGKCICTEYWKGIDCSVRSDLKDDTSTYIINNKGGNLPVQTNKCKPNDEVDVVCSGLGSCRDICECDERDDPKEKIYGEYCECSNYSCIKYNGEICGGATHGTCDCGTCNCTKPWHGKDCSKPGDNCYTPGSTELCSGYGDCISGNCRCLKGYSGKFCEIGINKTDGCHQLRVCVECQMYGIGKIASDCLTDCSLYIISVHSVEQRENTTFCKFTDEGDLCTYEFVYYNSTKEFTIEAQYERDCPQQGKTVFSLV